MFLQTFSAAFAETTEVREYVFSLRQHFSENPAPFSNNKAVEFSETDYSAQGRIIISFTTSDQANLKIIYTSGQNSRNADSLFVLANINGATQNFYAEKNLTASRLFFVKKLVSFLKDFREDEILLSDSRKESFYDGCYESHFVPLRKSRGVHLYRKLLIKFNNDDLLKTRTVFDRGNCTVGYVNNILDNIALSEKKRQKFGSILLSRVETNFVLQAVDHPGQNHKKVMTLDTLSACQYEIFSQPSVASRKRSMVASCLANRSLPQILNLFTDPPNDFEAAGRKYICLVEAIYHFYPDSAYRLERIYSESAILAVKQTIRRGAVESMCVTAHNYIAASLKSGTDTEEAREILIQLTALGYTESEKLVEQLVTISSNKIDENSNNARLCIAAISAGIHESDPQSADNLNDLLYTLFTKTEPSFADSMRYLHQLANNHDRHRSFFIKQFSGNPLALADCIAALRGMPDSVTCDVIRSLSDKDFAAVESEIAGTLLTYYPHTGIRKLLSKLFRKSKSNDLKESITGFLKNFEEEIPGLHDEIKILTAHPHPLPR